LEWFIKKQYPDFFAGSFEGENGELGYSSDLPKDHPEHLNPIVIDYDIRSENAS
jgi:hypothetical protein